MKIFFLIFIFFSSTTQAQISCGLGGLSVDYIYTVLGPFLKTVDTDCYKDADVATNAGLESVCACNAKKIQIATDNAKRDPKILKKLVPAQSEQVVSNALESSHFKVPSSVIACTNALECANANIDELIENTSETAFRAKQDVVGNSPIIACTNALECAYANTDELINTPSETAFRAKQDVVGNSPIKDQIQKEINNELRVFQDNTTIDGFPCLNLDDYKRIAMIPGEELLQELDGDLEFSSTSTNPLSSKMREYIRKNFDASIVYESLSDDDRVEFETRMMKVLKSFGSKKKSKVLNYIKNEDEIDLQKNALINEFKNKSTALSDKEVITLLDDIEANPDEYGVSVYLNDSLWDSIFNKDRPLDKQVPSIGSCRERPDFRCHESFNNLCHTYKSGKDKVSDEKLAKLKSANLSGYYGKIKSFRELKKDVGGTGESLCKVSHSLDIQDKNGNKVQMTFAQFSRDFCDEKLKVKSAKPKNFCSTELDREKLKYLYAAHISNDELKKDDNGYLEKFSKISKSMIKDGEDIPPPKPKLSAAISGLKAQTKEEAIFSGNKIYKDYYTQIGKKEIASLYDRPVSGEASLARKEIKDSSSEIPSLGGNQSFAQANSNDTLSSPNPLRPGLNSFYGGAVNSAVNTNLNRSEVTRSSEGTDPELESLRAQLEAQRKILEEQQAQLNPSPMNPSLAEEGSRSLAKANNDQRPVVSPEVPRPVMQGQANVELSYPVGSSSSGRAPASVSTPSFSRKVPVNDRNAALLSSKYGVSPVAQSETGIYLASERQKTELPNLVKSSSTGSVIVYEVDSKTLEKIEANDLATLSGYLDKAKENGVSLIEFKDKNGKSYEFYLVKDKDNKFSAIQPVRKVKLENLNNQLQESSH